jgi:hypothetical protein
MVPVIVNAILNEHQLVIDIVAFVIKGDFHRSRLGEKQRGKILAGWVTRKMRTIAQYSIRDPNGPENQMMISEEPVGRQSMSMSIGGTGGMRGPGSTKGSLRAGSTLGMTAQLNSMQLSQQQNNAIAEQVPGQSIPGSFAQQQPYGMNDNQSPHSSYYPQSIPELSPQGHNDPSDVTPTEARHSFLPQLEQPGFMDYSPVDRAGPFLRDGDQHTGPGDHNYQQQTYGNAQLPESLRPGTGDTDNMPTPQPFYSDSQPYDYGANQHGEQEQGSRRWSFDSQDRGNGNGNGDRYEGGYDGGGYGGYGGGGGGGLRVANRDSSESESGSWTRDVVKGLNFAGGTGK